MPPQVDPPYRAILKALEDGRVVPFFGAGASTGGRPDGVAWTASAQFLPRAAELSQHLADEVEFISQDPRDRADLLKVSAYYEQAVGREGLRHELRDVLAGKSHPSALHEFFASLPGPQLLVTTNYDTLLEQAFRAAGKPFDLLIYPSDTDETGTTMLWWPSEATEPRNLAPDEIEVDLTKQTVIYKMHGTVDEPPASEWSNFVITEDDYVNFLSRMTRGTAVPKSFYRYFRGRSFLFLGYSLSDWNLRVVLRNLGREFEIHGAHGGVKHWAIQAQPSSVEEWLWSQRGVNVYDQTVETFVDRLKAARSA